MAFVNNGRFEKFTEKIWLVITDNVSRINEICNGSI